MTDPTQGFALVRILDATPEDVWDAWTDPDHAAEWWHPRELTTPRETVAIDLRVDGRYTYTMVSEATGEQFVTGGVYREIEPLKRLVFTWGDPADDDAPVATVTIEPADELTRMTFELHGVEGSKGDDDFYDGWDQALDFLTAYLDDSPAGPTG